MKIFITGTAGFIGFHLVEALLKCGHDIVGLDNINDYYDVGLKYARLEKSGVLKENIKWNRLIQSNIHAGYRFIKADINDKATLFRLCSDEKFELIVNLAAQAGVRYSIENPDAYIHSNLIGFFNILEAARMYSVKNIIYASSSSVYGTNIKIPFSTDDNTDAPASLYAATKKSNELMAHTYTHLYGIRTTGLRFFTVYGPWGRPDMAYYLFAEAIRTRKAIKVFNNGKLKRDFTYIDDIVKGIENIINASVDKDLKPDAKIYNIGNNQPVELMDFIEEIERNMGIKVNKEYVGMQPGDVLSTWADIDYLAEDFNYRPFTPLSYGINQFIEWYKSYYSYRHEY